MLTFGRAPLLPAIAACTLALATAACGGDSDPASNIVRPKPEVLGAWQVNVVEQADSCDAQVSPIVDPRMQVERDGSDYRVRFDEYDQSGWCWVMPFQKLSDEVLGTEYGAIYEHDCNPGCRVRMDTSVMLTFSLGGTFIGIERTVYTPQTAECDVPACAFPCEARAFHPIWGPPPIRRCGFACEVTFAWTGALVAPSFVGMGCAPP